MAGVMESGHHNRLVPWSPITPAIDKYVVLRRAELLAEGCPNYRVTLIREIEPELRFEPLVVINNSLIRNNMHAPNPTSPKLDLVRGLPPKKSL